MRRGGPKNKRRWEEDKEEKYDAEGKEETIGRSRQGKDKQQRLIEGR